MGAATALFQAKRRRLSAGVSRRRADERHAGRTGDNPDETMTA